MQVLGKHWNSASNRLTLEQCKYWVNIGTVQVLGKHCNSATSCWAEFICDACSDPRDPPPPPQPPSHCATHSIVHLYLIRPIMLQHHSVASVSHAVRGSTGRLLRWNSSDSSASHPNDLLSSSVHSNQWIEIDKFDGILKEDLQRCCSGLQTSSLVKKEHLISRSHTLITSSKAYS